MSKTLPTEAPLLEWKAPQRDYHEHGVKWYIVATVFLALCLLYAVWTAAWSFIVVLILASALYLYARRTPPKELQLRIWKKGYALENRFFPWEDCAGYWMLQSHLSTTLNIAHQKALTSLTKIQLGTLHPHDVQEVLDQFLPQIQNKKENLIDTIIHICKL